MHTLSLFLSLVTSATFSFAAVTTPSVQVYQYDGPVNEGSYIVKMLEDADKTSVLSMITSLSGGDTVTHDWSPEFFNGFAGLSPCTGAILELTRLP